MEYSKLRLWNENAEVAGSLLMEYHASHADKPEKLGTTIRAVRMQLHENQVCLKTYGPFSLQQTVTGLVFKKKYHVLCRIPSTQKKKGQLYLYGGTVKRWNILM